MGFELLSSCLPDIQTQEGWGSLTKEIAPTDIPVQHTIPSHSLVFLQHNTHCQQLLLQVWQTHLHLTITLPAIEFQLQKDSAIVFLW